MKLLDTIKERYNVISDAELSRKLNVAPPTISRIRNGIVGVSPEIILRIYDAFGMSIEEIRELL